MNNEALFKIKSQIVLACLHMIKAGRIINVLCISILGQVLMLTHTHTQNTHTHTPNKHTHTQNQTHPFTHTHNHTHILPHTHTHTHTPKNTPKHTHTHVLTTFAK